MSHYSIIDAHCDTMSELLHRGGTLLENDLCVSLPKLSDFDGYVQFFAAWVDDSCPKPLQEALSVLEVYHRELTANTDRIQPILCAADFEKVFHGNKVGAMLTVENGNVLEGTAANLCLLYRLGVRALTLTWNGANELGDGILEERGAGLTDFGRQVVKEMNRLGMMIDVSHLSERGFWEVLEESKAPVMASHSNSRAGCSVPRNLTDKQIQALSERGGVIGLNLYPAFLTGRETAGLSDCLRHAEHILTVGGEDCLGLGSDFDGFSGNMPVGISGPQDYGSLFQAMRDNDFSEDLIEKISYKNFLNFAGKILK